MPSLRILNLSNCIIPSPLPPLPSLTQLTFSGLCLEYTVPASLLLRSLQNTPNLEHFHLSGYDIAGISEDTLSVKLPRLVDVYIRASDLGSSIILKNMHYSSSAIVQYSYESASPVATLDISNIVEICSRLGHQNAPPVNTIEISSPGPTPRFLSLKAESSNPDSDPPLSLFFDCAGLSQQLYDVCFQLCGALPRSSVDTLRIDGFEGVEQSKWEEQLQDFGAVQVLEVTRITHHLLDALRKESKQNILFPNLRRLVMQVCVFIEDDTSDDLPEGEKMFLALQDFLNQRNDLGPPIQTLVIQKCSINFTDVMKLGRYVDVEWDGDVASDADDYW